MAATFTVVLLITYLPQLSLWLPCLHSVDVTAMLALVVEFRIKPPFVDAFDAAIPMPMRRLPGARTRL